MFKKEYRSYESISSMMSLVRFAFVIFKEFILLSLENSFNLINKSFYTMNYPSQFFSRIVVRFFYYTLRASFIMFFYFIFFMFAALMSFAYIPLLSLDWLYVRFSRPKIIIN